MQPHRWQPTRLPHPWDSPVKNTGVGCHFLLLCMKPKRRGKNDYLVKRSTIIYGTESKERIHPLASLRQHILMWWRWHSWSQWVVQLDMSLHWNGGTMPRHSSLSLHHRGHYHGDMWFSQDDNQKTHFHILKKMELCVFQKIHHKFWCSSWALDYYCQVDNVMASILFLV